MSEGKKLSAQIAASATTLITGGVGLWRAFAETIPIAVILILVAVVAAGLNIWVAVNVYKANKSARHKVEDVEKYLRGIIESKSSGKTAIFTHRMTWVTTDATRDALRAKARQGNLTIFTTTESDFFKELVSLGAKVHNYANLGKELKTSFTITQHDELNAMVYVGLPEDDQKHIKIEKFLAREHPTAWLARDVKEILTSVGILAAR